MIPIHYTIKGEGFPVILIHGFCETGEIWNSLADRISSQIQVITIDLPGFGQSRLSSSHFTLEEIGTELNKWVLEHGFENSILIGHSLGGYISLAMVAQKPILFSGFGLFHSTSEPDSEIKRLNRSKVMEFVRANGVAAFVDSFIPDLYHIKNHPSVEFAVKIARNTPKSTFLTYTEAMRDRPSREDVLATSMIPVLIIGGKNDPVIPIESLREQGELSSKITFHELPKVGHMGMFEAESETASIINSFATAVKDTRPT